MKLTIWAALAEPRRLQIVELLRGGPLTVGEIADRLLMRQPQVSKHLRVLHEGGIVEVQAEANRRIYQLRPEPFDEINSWLERYRDLWIDKFDNLEACLNKLQMEKQTQDQSNDQPDKEQTKKE